MSNQKQDHVHFYEYKFGEWDSGSEVVYNYECSCGKKLTNLCGSGKELILLVRYNSHLWKVPECPKGALNLHSFSETNGFIICNYCKGMIKNSKEGVWKW